MTQLIALVLIAYTPTGVTSQRLGDFYDMKACAKAAVDATLVGPEADVHIRFACVPLTPVATSPLIPRR